MDGAVETWDLIRRRVLARDGHRCTVSRLLGGGCRGPLHVHHLIPRNEGGTDETDNLLTACAAHHRWLESVRRWILDGREPRGWRRCPHEHRYSHARKECERRLNTAA